MKIVTISAEEVFEKQQNGALLIDLSDSNDYRREHISGAISLPIHQLKQKGLPRETETASELIFYCRVGMRTKMVAPNIEQMCHNKPIYMLADGLRSWKTAQLPLTADHSVSVPMDLMRQVQITAGGLVFLGAILGWLITPYFYILSAFVGAGLVFAGLTGWCGMAMLLAKMPWNNR